MVSAFHVFQCFSGNECILCFIYFIYYFIMSFSDCRTVIRQTPPNRHFRDQTIPWQNISPIGLPRPVISPPDTFRIIIIFAYFPCLVFLPNQGWYKEPLYAQRKANGNARHFFSKLRLFLWKRRFLLVSFKN